MGFQWGDLAVKGGGGCQKSQNKGDVLYGQPLIHSTNASGRPPISAQTRSPNKSQKLSSLELKKANCSPMRIL